MNRTWKLTLSNAALLSCIVLISMAICTGCGGSQAHQAEAHQLAGLMHALLISENLCKDINDCRKMEYLFVRPSEPVEITVCGVTNRLTAKKIVDLCIGFHARNPRIEYKLTMYAETKEKTGFFKSKATIQYSS